MERPSNRRLDGVWVLSLISVIGLFVVNIVGFLDTETGSALGCGRQWPLCNNSIVPTFKTEQTIIEFAHRSIVGVVTLLLIVTSIAAWRRYGKWLEVKLFVSLMLGFVFLEAVLGALGVIFSDPPPVLAFHLGVSLVAFVAAVLLMAVVAQIQRALRRDPEQPRIRSGELPKGFRVLAAATLIYTFIAIYIGAYIASIGAGASFRGFPIPMENYQQAGVNFYFDILHRSIALGLVLLCVALVVVAYRARRKDLRWGTWLAVIFVVLQGLSGALLVWTHLSTTAFLFHVSNVSCLFATLSYLWVQSLPEPHRERETVDKAAYRQAPNRFYT